MLNLLIATENIFYAKDLANFIVSRNKEIRLINISTNGSEAIKNILSNFIDILILDLKMPGLSGIEVLNILIEKELNQKIIFIVISEEKQMLPQIKENSLEVHYIKKSKGIPYIFEKLEMAIAVKKTENDNNNLKNKILNELLFLGYNIKHQGTIYLMEIIYLICQIGAFNVTHNLERCLYSKIAKMHFKTVETVKSNIVKATNYMYIESDKEKIKKYFKFLYEYKPTPKVVIITVSNKIVKYMQMEEDYINKTASINKKDTSRKTGNESKLG